MTENEQTLLRVLAGQSEGYLLHPDASAVVAEGLSYEEALEALSALAQAGHAQEEEFVEHEPAVDDKGEPILDADGALQTRPKLDQDGKDLVTDSGWTITATGLAELPAPPAEVTP